MKLFCLLILTCSILQAGEWQSLFDGKTLGQWEARPGGKWEVVDGVIHGRQEKSEKRHGILLSKKEYSDFEITFKYKALEGNSGFYFRCTKVDHIYSVKGFQTEIDSTAKHSNGFYETLGRAWVVKPSKEKIAKVYKIKDWNELKLRAVGRHVVSYLNGQKMAELIHDKGNLKGYFGFQLHGSQKMDVQFKDIKILDLSKSTDVGRSFITSKIHNKKIPLPPIKMPLAEKDLMEKSKAPEKAVILFDGKNLDNWKNKNWKLIDGVMQSQKGSQYSTASFGSGHYHVEWRVVDNKSPGNSGVFINGLYEVQVFNSHNNRTKVYADGQAAAIYGQYPPAFNVCREPGQWEYFDIHFTAPVFENGKLIKKARMTVFHNGIRVHDDVELTGLTGHHKRPAYKKNVTQGPLKLQDHKDRVEYRNIWFLPKEK